MPAPCRPDHVFREPLPGGLALYPVACRSPPYSGESDWLGDEGLLAHVDSLDGPAVYLDMATVDHVGCAGIGPIIRLGKRARDRGGRVALCSVRPIVREIFRALQVDTLPWLDLRDGGMPGRGPRPPDPAWLSWGGGVVAAMARSFAEGRDLGLVPVLGDALEEAGCGLGELLDHCRGPGPHARDCWAIRLLLGAS